MRNLSLAICLVTSVLTCSCSNNQKAFSNTSNIGTSKEYKGGYSNPYIANPVAQFSSKELRISKLKDSGEPEQVQGLENLFYFSETADSSKEDVVVMNYLSNPITYFVDEINNGNSSGLINTTVFKVHRRKIVPDGYDKERYILVVQSSNNKTISIQIGKVGEDSMYSYL